MCESEGNYSWKWAGGGAGDPGHKYCDSSRDQSTLALSREGLKFGEVELEIELLPLEQRASERNCSIKRIECCVCVCVWGESFRVRSWNPRSCIRGIMRQNLQGIPPCVNHFGKNPKVNLYPVLVGEPEKIF